MMDASERELFAKVIATAVVRGDAGLHEVGWRDAFAADPHAAVATWFEAQGAANAVSDALAIVVGAGFVREAGGGLDPSFGRVRIDGASDESVAAGRRALAHELIGASRAMLELARTHALDRVQFDVPIASFQAVRHRLAEAYVAIEAADAAVDAAWEEATPFAAAIAKAVAGRSARTVAKHAQQVLAGIGFTAEHPFHRHFRRTRVLDALLGDHRSLTRDLGASLLSDRVLPPILPL